MKGIIFTEFVEMVENHYGYKLMDDIILSSDLPSGGIYTAVGTYDHNEMTTLVHGLSQRTHVPPNELFKTYGKYLFKGLHKNYPQFFESSNNTFDFLEGLTNTQNNARKLYPDAELPKYETHRISENVMEMTYSSERKMGDLEEGLMIATLDYFQEKATIQQILLSDDGSKIKFIISKNGQRN